MVSERLTLVNVGYVNFDHRAIKRVQGIQNGHRRVRIGGGIDDNARCRCARLLHPIDKLPFVVGLVEPDRQAQIFGQGRAKFGDIIKRLRAIDFGLTQTKQIKVRAVKYENWLRHGAILTTFASRIAILAAGTSQRENLRFRQLFPAPHRA